MNEAITFFAGWGIVESICRYFITKNKRDLLYLILFFAVAVSAIVT